MGAIPILRGHNDQSICKLVKTIDHIPESTSPNEVFLPSTHPLLQEAVDDSGSKIHFWLSNEEATRPISPNLENSGVQETKTINSGLDSEIQKKEDVIETKTDKPPSGSKMEHVDLIDLKKIEVLLCSEMEKTDKIETILTNSLLSLDVRDGEVIAAEKTKPPVISDRMVKWKITPTFDESMMGWKEIKPIKPPKGPDSILLKAAISKDVEQLVHYTIPP
ncbi:hypothetical protein CROQUDRAFT_97107 [Cronartium quercuum f. sp. fusiforme G11]|uniref:Uncharacterized protein n=1 Tax=Cronartium quercuum f. sp. fusiforme G11 TaxID=708437 RepID=A0A9P6NA63_9BASI|nr:hypothetical protein CROQUDRAFT_97107 [Cronartium quercuum f. sp. fusiforme G11]